jgi:hypothetical protein
MSIVLQSSGGGSITINEPTTASNFTQTLPAADGTVMVSGNQPAFSAYPNATLSATNATFTKLLFQVEEYDTNNNFASSRFTPTVAGYYQISGMMGSASSPATGTLLFSLYKNGTRYLDGNQIPFSSNNPKNVLSALVSLNGSTDYLELYAYQTSGIAATLLGSGLTEGYFQGCLVRAA